MTSPITPTDHLADLHQRMKACTACLDAGYQVAPPAVFSGGLGAQVMTIGQAPGITEQAVGRPFNAGSGKRLFEWLSEAGFAEDEFRATQYMTSVTKCYPGRTARGGGDRVPSRAEQQFCRPFLDQEIELIDPTLIIPIGKLAIGLFFNRREPLTKIIGRRLIVDGRVVIPLPHPSGASTWHLKDANRALLDQAIALIREERLALGL